MKTKTHTKNNRLIAEFMGNNRGMIFTSELPVYHNDWNELIPAVEKIEQLQGKNRGGYNESYKVIIYNNTCEIWRATEGHEYRLLFQRDGATKIEASYKAVIQFINWHNKNTPYDTKRKNL